MRGARGVGWGFDIGLSQVTNTEVGRIQSYPEYTQRVGAVRQGKERSRWRHSLHPATEMAPIDAACGLQREQEGLPAALLDICIEI